jgi:nicotinate-nucleotide pyrophosphorylase (carboxylating)
MNLDFLIKEALKEDIGRSGDVTSECLLKKGKKEFFVLIANENAVISGIDLFKGVFKCLNKKIVLKTKFKNGDIVKKGTKVISLHGDALSILMGERTAINFISHLSGIATETRKIVDLIKSSDTKLLDTRKTTPLFRTLEKKAVFHGGGINHRMTLSDMVLIKDNHISSSGSVKNAVLKAKNKYKGKLKIEVEVENLSQLKEAIEACPDVIMFDNWDVNKLKSVLKLVPKKIKTEISGQINPKNIRKYANVGADYISTSYMIKNSKWVDFSLEVSM